MRSKKILLLSSYGGYGHVAAASTIQTLLGDEYEIEIAYPIREMRILGIPRAESIYNFFLKNNLIQLTNWVAKWITPVIFKLGAKKIIEQVSAHIKEKKPDLLISLIPYVNYPVSEACFLNQLPMLLVTTDNDLENWCFALKKRRQSDFAVTIGRDLPTSKSLLIKRGIPQSAIHTVGLPLRPEFFESLSKEELRERYKVPKGKETVLIMMGGMGARSTYDYVETLAQSDLGIHLIVCAGKNAKLLARLKTIEPKEGNTVEVIPFTDKVHELFKLADLLITKPGPGTINEAQFTKLPVLIDQMGVSLTWEKVNIQLVRDQKIGDAVQSLEQLPTLVRRFLRDEQTLEEIARAYETLPVNRFDQEINGLIDSMIPEQEEGLVKAFTP